MSYFVAYVVDGQDEPVDGDTVATGKGWQAWADFAAGQSGEFTEAAFLANEGYLEPPEALDELEHELEAILHGEADGDLKAITAGLLHCVKSRPPNCVGLIVTDGEPGGDEEDESTSRAGG